MLEVKNSSVLTSKRALGKQCKNTSQIGERDWLLRAYKLHQKSKSILRSVVSPNSSILKCMSHAWCDYVQVEKADGKASFDGLITCKSKHVCPVEAPTMARLEAEDIRQAVYLARKRGEDVYMWTPTFRHNKYMRLKDSMALFHSALQRFWRSGSVRRFFKSFFYGRITALEITWGESAGWHVHEHILLFGERGLMANPMVSGFFEVQWLKALDAVGLSGVSGVASSFQSASQVKDYLTKMPLEIACFSSKQGRVGHYTPFQLLDMSADASDKYADLWREYYLATKGCRVLVWSDGLKAKFGIDDCSDDELADRAMEALRVEAPELVLLISRVSWRSFYSPEHIAYIKTCRTDELLPYLDSLGVVYAL